MRSSGSFLLLSVLQLLFTLAEGWYLPGISPITYCASIRSGSQCKVNIPVEVNRLRSKKSFISFRYSKLDFCPLSNGSVPVENIGQILFGERLELSNYKIEFAHSETCKVLCTRKYDNSNVEKYGLLRRSIEMSYTHEWNVDNLPVIVCAMGVQNNKICQTSIPVGCYEPTSDHMIPFCFGLIPSPNAMYLLNHINFRIIYNPESGSWLGGDKTMIGGRIISVIVEPRSYDYTDGVITCSAKKPLALPAKLGPSGLNVTYTYSVLFEKDRTRRWASRWDYILHTSPQSKIQWLSILNTCVLTLFLSALLATIMFRNLRHDIAHYTELEGATAVQEESGWKLVHGDVFRPPTWCMCLSVLVGSGVQLFIMLSLTLFFACLGFLSPANRGALLTCALVLFACLGVSAGYASARIYKLFGGLRWKLNVIMTATFCPALIFNVFLVLNFALWLSDSATATPFTTIIAVLSLWLCVSLPLSFIGAFFGFRRQVIGTPVRTNQIPRQIPIQSFYGHPFISFFLGGLLPFSCIFIQLFFIFNSIWGAQFYFMFGFLFIVFVMLVVTIAETSILMCYFQLCREDYRWWWRSLSAGAGTSFYLLLYSIHYFLTRLEFQDPASAFLYFGYTFIIVILNFMFTGSVGFFACLWFVLKIYSVVKVD